MRILRCTFLNQLRNSGRNLLSTDQWDRRRASLPPRRHLAIMICKHWCEEEEEEEEEKAPKVCPEITREIESMAVERPLQWTASPICHSNPKILVIVKTTRRNKNTVPQSNRNPSSDITSSFYPTFNSLFKCLNAIRLSIIFNLI